MKIKKDIQQLIETCENQLKHLEIKDDRSSDYVRGLNEGAKIILEDIIDVLTKMI